MQNKVTSCPLDWQKFKRMFTPTTDERKSIFSYVTGEKEDWYCLFGKQYEKKNFFKYLFIYLFMAVLGLCFCARAFSSCGKPGPLFIAVHGPLTIAASLVAEHRLQTRRLSNCGSRAQLLRGTWDLPRPGLEPVSPALAGRLSTIAPPGKPLKNIFKNSFPSTQLSHS